MDNTLETIKEYKEYVETNYKIDLTGFNLIQLKQASDAMFDDYYDLCGHRVDAIIKIMKAHNMAVIP